VNVLASTGPVAVTPGGFEVAADGARWTFRGDLTFDDAARVLEESARLPLPKSGCIDYSGLGVADSTALAVMVALKRRASHEHHKVAFEGVPEGLAALARVYGVAELIDVRDA
jgi:phospholipid transport system transporter-binding protein